MKGKVGVIQSQRERKPLSIGEKGSLTAKLHRTPHPANDSLQALKV
jgi:hypothetical protein